MDLNDNSQIPEEVERTSAPAEAFAPTPAATPQQKSKKSKAPLVLGLLLVLALVACGALGWMSYDQSTQKSSLATQLSDKDDQISELKSELKSVEKAEESDDSTTTDTSSSANDKMLEMAFAFATAKVKNRGFPEGATDLRGEIDKQTAEFTRVQVGSKSAGPGVGLVYFKKVGSEWVLLGDDNGNQARFNESFGMTSGF